MIDKACHRQMPNFKAEQWNIEIRKTSVSEKLTTAWAPEQYFGWEYAVVGQVLSQYLPYAQGYLRRAELQSRSCHWSVTHSF